jgi:hypothetical protein
MLFRRIAVVAACAVLLFAILETSLVPGLAITFRPWYTTITRTVLLAMVAATAALAAGTFGWWGEYVGRAWTLFLVEYSVLAVNTLLRRRAPSAGLALEATLIVANLAGIGAYWLMARSLTAAGLRYYGSTAKRVAVILLALLLAIVLCQSSILEAWHSIDAGQPQAGRLVSALADVLTFVLVAPLLLTTFALRGGQLVWVFGFLTTGTIGWMVNQGATSIAHTFGGGDRVARVIRNSGFAMACLFIAAAALTQWLAARRATRGVPHHA